MAFGDFVQGGFTDNPASPWTVAFTTNVVAGNLLVACFGRATNSTPTVTDSQGNTYSLARSHYDVGNDYRLDIWTAIAGSSAACSITVTAAGGSAEFSRAEFTGPFAASRLDVVNSAIGSSTSASSGNVTPTVSGDLAIGYHGAVNALTSTGSWTTRVNGNTATNIATIVQSQVRAGVTAFAATASLASGAWLSMVATFKPVVGFTIAANSGTYTITGTAAGATAARKIDAVAGVYAVTGAAATLLPAFRLLADTGGYVIVGTDATLIYTPVAGGGVYTMFHHHHHSGA